MPMERYSSQWRFTAHNLRVGFRDLTCPRPCTNLLWCPMEILESYWPVTLLWVWIRLLKDFIKIKMLFRGQRLRVPSERVLSLVRWYLQAGVRLDGPVSIRPQGMRVDRDGTKTVWASVWPQRYHGSRCFMLNALLSLCTCEKISTHLDLVTVVSKLYQVVCWQTVSVQV